MDEHVAKRCLTKFNVYVRKQEGRWRVNVQARLDRERVKHFGYKGGSIQTIAEQIREEMLSRRDEFLAHLLGGPRPESHLVIPPCVRPRREAAFKAYHRVYKGLSYAICSGSHHGKRGWISLKCCGGRAIAERVVREMHECRDEILRHFAEETKWRSNVLSDGWVRAKVLSRKGRFAAVANAVVGGKCHQLHFKCGHSEELAERIVAEILDSEKQIIAEVKTGSRWQSQIHAAALKASKDARTQERSTALQKRRQKPRLIIRIETVNGCLFSAVSEIVHQGKRTCRRYGANTDRNLAERIAAEMEVSHDEILRHFENGTRWQSAVLNSHVAEKRQWQERNCLHICVREDRSRFYAVAEKTINGRRQQLSYSGGRNRELAERIAAEMRDRKQELIDSLLAGLSWHSRVLSELEKGAVHHQERELVESPRAAAGTLAPDQDPELLRIGPGLDQDGFKERNESLWSIVRHVTLSRGITYALRFQAEHASIVNLWEKATNESLQAIAKDRQRKRAERIWWEMRNAATDYRGEIFPAWQTIAGLVSHFGTESFTDDAGLICADIRQGFGPGLCEMGGTHPTRPISDLSDCRLILRAVSRGWCKLQDAEEFTRLDAEPVELIDAFRALDRRMPDLLPREQQEAFHRMLQALRADWPKIPPDEEITRWTILAGTEMVKREQAEREAEEPDQTGSEARPGFEIVNIVRKRQRPTKAKRREKFWTQ